MDNYKIKVKDEAESKEAISLLIQLGYKDSESDRFGFVYTIGEKIGCDFLKHWDYYSSQGCKELTLPRLRDLVVLKRNDVSDANVYEDAECSCLYDLYLTSDRELYFYHCGKGKWIISSLNHDKDYYATLKPIQEQKPQDPALISGADAHKALLAGENVQYSGDGGEEHWDTALNCNIGVFLNPEKFPSFKFRIVPRTIKVELDLPKPFEPKLGDEYFCINDSELSGWVRYEHDGSFDPKDFSFGTWRTLEEIEQVVAQLKKIRGAS